MGDLITASVAYDLWDGAKQGNVEEGFIDMGAGSLVSKLIGLIIMVIAGYLAWNCNKKTHWILRIVYTLLAAYFGLLYLIYYFIRYQLIGDTCGRYSPFETGMQKGLKMGEAAAQQTAQQLGLTTSQSPQELGGFLMGGKRRRRRRKSRKKKASKKKRRRRRKSKAKK